MQLKRPQPIHGALTAVTVALLGSSTAHAVEAKRVDSSLLIYNETNRVKAGESVTSLTGTLDPRHTFNVHLTIDGLTGASPNGTTPASTVQTFTGSSGKVGFTAQPGQIPLDNSFRDTRIGVDGTITAQLDRLATATYGGHLSLEKDYFSIGANGGVSRDFFQKNLTLSLTGAYSLDAVAPRGGPPTPFNAMPPPSDQSVTGEEGATSGGPGAAGAKGKNVLDTVAGFTQVLDRSTLLSGDYSAGLTAGYLNDPYKLLSLVQSTTDAAPGEPLAYLYEKRPSTRLRQALFADLKRYVFGAAIDVSYRYYWDDWGIRSRTFDVVPHLPLPAGHSLEPHFRWYRQSAADFHHWYLVDGQPLPGYASADSRLAAFDAVTIGAKYALPVGGDHISFSAEYYKQTSTRGPPNPIGSLAQYDLFPPLHVLMFRVGYTHDL